MAVAVCRADQCLGESAATTAKHYFSRSWSRPVISSSIQHRPSISSNVEVSLHRHLHSVSAIRGGGGGRQHGRQKKAAVDDDDDDGGKASMLSSIFNLGTFLISWFIRRCRRSMVLRDDYFIHDVVAAAVVSPNSQNLLVPFRLNNNLAFHYMPYSQQCCRCWDLDVASGYGFRDWVDSSNGDLCCVGCD